ncbi:MAG: FAD:protein FMN transferase [Agriterribacter sp.]
MKVNKGIWLIQICSVVLMALLSSNVSAQTIRKRVTTLMGSRFEIIITAKDSASAEQYIDTVIAEITRIESLISEWRPATQISEVNNNAGIRPVKVDKEVFELTRRAIYFSRISDGAFDISFAAMDRIWKFDDSMTEMPSPESVKKSVAKVGYRNIILDSINSTIFLKLEGMKIGFGSIGKGYAADRGRQVMLEHGVYAGIVNASGDMTAWGTQPDGTGWKIGITNPFNADSLLAIIALKNASVTTSGSYEKYVEFNGRRYSHIINPKTGYPATGLTSVTVTGPNAETANGFSTALMVLGRKKGLRLIKKYPAYSCIMITDKGKVVKSENFNKHVETY